MKFLGSYMQSGIGVTMYDGSVLASTQDVVVVTIAFREGAFGFLAVGDIPGQWGILDQRLGLEWIQANIVEFGGDPEQVTLFGQSSGATSVSVHLVSPDSWPLFQYAILESNPSGMPTLTFEGMTPEAR